MEISGVASDCADGEFDLGTVTPGDAEVFGLRGFSGTTSRSSPADVGATGWLELTSEVELGCGVDGGVAEG